MPHGLLTRWGVARVANHETMAHERSRALTKLATHTTSGEGLALWLVRVSVWKLARGTQQACGGRVGTATLKDEP